MTSDYSIADMMIGVRNMIEAAGLRAGDQVLLLADTRSDKPTVEALNAGLRFFGAEPMILVTEPIARYGDVPQADRSGRPRAALLHPEPLAGDAGDLRPAADHRLTRGCSIPRADLAGGA